MNKENEPPQKATLWQILLAVVWGFFGVRKHKEWQSDANSLKPAQVIIGGLIGGVIFVIVLVIIVRLVIS